MLYKEVRLNSLESIYQGHTVLPHIKREYLELLRESGKYALYKLEIDGKEYYVLTYGDNVETISDSPGQAIAFADVEDLGLSYNLLLEQLHLLPVQRLLAWLEEDRERLYDRLRLAEHFGPGALPQDEAVVVEGQRSNKIVEGMPIQEPCCLREVAKTRRFTHYVGSDGKRELHVIVKNGKWVDAIAYFLDDLFRKAFRANLVESYRALLMNLPSMNLDALYGQLHKDYEIYNELLVVVSPSSQ